MADISKITLPSGGTYDIKDAVARAAINGIFVIAWNGTAAPTVNKVPAGVTMTFGNPAQTYTGTLTANDDANTSTMGKFYLVKSSSQQNPDLKDIYDEYVTVDNGSGANPRYTWEKIGDTQIKLTEVVTGINYNPQTATVVGTGATLKINTYPTYKVTPATTYIKASSSGGAVTASGDNVTVMTGIGTPDKENVLKSVSVTSKKLQTTGIYGVKSGDNTTTASKATQTTTQKTAKGTGTSSSDNTNWLKGVSVSNEVLTIGAATMDLQDTTQFTFSNVTVPIRADSSTTVANGNLVATSNTSNVGDTLVSVVEAKSTDKVAAITGIPSPTTDTVIGTSSTLSITTNPTITLATDANSGTGRVLVAKGDQVTVSKTADGAIGFNNTDSKTVLTSATTITATHPS